MNRTFENALKLLNSRRRVARPSNPSASVSEDAASAASPAPTLTGAQLKGTPSLTGMKEWLQVIGYSDTDLASLNIIHVAGTKGKGSTCAFVRSLLQSYSLRTRPEKPRMPRKIGMYTSPDLRSVLERIQIDNAPISRSLFTLYFFDVWEKLEIATTSSGIQTESGVRVGMPRFLQLLALVAIHAFKQEETDAVIFETHHGGEYDATNVFSAPVVTAITTIGMDHVAQLGPTLENVAWHKAGIWKTGSVAVSVEGQEKCVEKVLVERGKEKGNEVEFVGIDERVDRWVEVPVQKINCSLAVGIVQRFLARAWGGELTAEDIKAGAEGFTWPGRFQTIEDEKKTMKWFLDGAHNELSIVEAVKWFADATEQESMPIHRILIFTHISTEREALPLLAALARALHEHKVLPEDVIFTTFQEREDGSRALDKTAKDDGKCLISDIYPPFADTWRQTLGSHSRGSKLWAEQSIEGAIEKVRSLYEENENGQAMQARVLVTGSLHLVGGALNILDPLQ